MYSDSSFDSLKTTATALERNLDSKLSQYISSTNSQAPDLEGGAPLANEITSLLSQFNNINQSLATAATKSSHEIILKRFRELLYDYQEDFKKAESTHARRQQQAELFSGHDNPNSNNSQELDALLRERSAINNSFRSTTDILGQASSIRGELRNQRTSLMNSVSGVTSIISNVPGVNRLIDAIQRKKQRDNFVLGGVIAVCCFVTFWYLFG